VKILYAAAESSNFVINLCNEFAKRGHKVTCIVQDFDAYDKENPIREHQSLTVFKLPMETFLNNIRFEKIINKHLDEGEFDVVFCSHAVICPPVIVSAKKHEVPVGVMLLDIPTDLMEQQPKRKTQWDYWFNFLRAADVIMVNTYVAGEEYERYTGQPIDKETEIVTYAINKSIMFKNKGMDKRGDYVLSICRLTELKNCILIPKAIKASNLDLKYVAVGRNGGQLDEIMKYCADNNIRFEHYNNVSEYRKFRLIEDCAMLIYPQKSEYIGGLSPFEAMYVGKPAVVPKVRVLQDLYGDHAYYFKNDDAESLGEIMAILSVVDLDQSKEFLEKASDFADEEADFGNMAEKMLKRMERMIK